jgi:imidazolonepropionase-like amidohydrolase
MKLFIVFLVAIILGFAGNAQLLIRNTTVVDVEARKLLPGQTVVVEDGKIKAVGKKISVPQDAQVIDGTGKYLLPGFVDAHVHFFQSGGVYTRPDAVDLRKYKPYEQEIAWVHNNMENFLRRYTAAGITTVVDVGSTINFLKQRDTFQNKEYAPTVYMTGPLLTTWQPPVFKGLKDDEPFYEMKTVEDARKYVQLQLPHRPDFIKIWYIVQGRNTDSAARVHLPLVRAVIDEAHKNNLRVAVHATERITAQLAVEAGANLLVHGVDDEPVDAAFVQLLRNKKVVLTPTLVVFDGYATALGQSYQLSAHDFFHAHPTPLNSVVDFKHLPDSAVRKMYRAAFENRRDRARRTDSLLRLNLKRLVDGGVIIATGTDAGNIGTHHVASYINELKAMQQSGLSMWQLLQASTINGAKAVGKEAEFGSIKTGKRAYLVLLNKNPLDSISNWGSIEWVINKGVAQKPDSIRKLSPLEVVEMQALAYNAHNLDLYMLTMHDSIQIFRLPLNTVDLEGKDSVRKGYEFLNSSPDLYARILNRIVEENMIVDHEEVFFQGATKPFYGIAIYYVRGGKIRRMYFW